MSGLFPAFEKRVLELDNAYINGKALGHELEILDSLAEQLHVTALTEFIDSRSMAEELLEDDDPTWKICRPYSGILPNGG